MVCEEVLHSMLVVLAVLFLGVIYLSKILRYVFHFMEKKRVGGGVVQVWNNVDSLLSFLVEQIIFR